MNSKFSIRLHSESAKKGVTGAVLLFLRLLKQAFKTFSANDPLRMAAATAFFTTFALPPILIIIIQVLGLVFERNLSRGVFSRLSSTIGRNSTHQIIDTLQAFREMASNWYVTIIGFVILIFVATNLFKIIKDSINQIWKIRMIAKQNFWKTMRGRWQALIIIMLTGTLFCIAILAEGMQTYLSDELVSLMPGLANYLKSIFNYGFSVVFVTAWFVILFRYLPDGRPLWTVAIAGAFFTSIFFNIGKIVLRILLNQSNLNNFYGASASIVLLLLFVFYSSLILYFGAAFTKAWADHHETPIKPKTGAVRYRWSEIHEE
ncbi:YihY/virulence factor BrkB family protein [Arcticibacter eurypsychrophilus]|uniref:YihY/virulence factor BrkB family protein n=1 Tax=Arcticibacter eurypsychrophilus TaxID=1434752 RepID=UPI0009F53513|nr:YihY/virulence factor BrkB family protein [Arcticibacter eurypsychrophilus]